ncbi:MAG TPA: hypothetical protein VFI34_07590 [Candidatus Limnocylindrales bacterium]|nr:hypothetical protein [Candidatus Limnocylindrales bacterium]
MDPTTFDPQTFDLGIVLTAAGVPIAAAIIASVIQLAKRIPVAGPALDNGREAVLAMVLAAALVALAFSSVGVPVTIVSLFGAFLAWVNLATFATKAYDVAPDALKSVLGGTTTTPPAPPTPPAAPPSDPPAPPVAPTAPADPVTPSTPDPTDQGDQGTDVTPTPDEELGGAAPARVAARCAPGAHGRSARRRRRLAGA